MASRTDPGAPTPISTARRRTATEHIRKERERQRSERVRVLDVLAERRDEFRAKNQVYYDEVERLAKFFIPEGSSVLEIGCSTGHLLAACKPSRGVGIDLSPRTIEMAKANYPDLEFHVADAEELDLGGETFDYVIMSDVIGHFSDVWTAFRSLQKVMRPTSRLFATYYNYLWEPAMRVARTLGRMMPVPQQNWLGKNDIINLLSLNGMEVVQSGGSMLVPAKVPGVSALANRILARTPGFRNLTMMRYFLARPIWQHRRDPQELSASVICACRNERGNVEDIFARTPDMGKGTELIFVDGSSDDGTVEEIERLLPTRPNTRLIHQGDGIGKGDAVRKGFEAATGDVLFILDADLTVPPEDLPKFYSALAEGWGEFINGTRLVYPMEKQAMRFLNMLGNHFFSVAFSYILGRPIKDTLCGTKVLSKEHYQQIADNRDYFGEFDPFGDFDLLFGAARQGMKIVEVPVRYRAREYGDTKISRFRHGFLLLRMTGIGYWKFKLTV